ncbi:hypothetical protein SAMD00019534_019340 [Acytostelium subglobosum LB1]|uniref:hypothetical protein n=1 Tax=Acytostelium subglobosum LB1 TaxID=1410327 RepID=UPI000644B667|nr:hypothetical protein SAMD00019534_019340 [Acytostelium subglobosum LB1]GAM18759.1 hypothetical protein SAMD00019534_019340 [Acytostelium subglobosum LB1]|eukprot:XP_012757979.1 hypothetical protein SAMD00019534_019340 [Acytostelium subglobosum LB1]
MSEITVPYQLYKETTDLPSRTKYLITQASYKAVAESSEITVLCEYTIRVFKQSSSDNNGDVIIPLISQRATISHSSITVDSGRNHNSDGISVGACIVTQANAPAYQLYTSHAGIYHVKLTVHVPYLTIKKTGMELQIPSSSNNSISFQVPHANANIKIFNSFMDVEATDQWLERAGKEVPNYTVTFAKLPNETTLRAQWTIKTETAPVNNNNNNKIDASKVQKPPNIVVVQNILGSIGEGLLILKSQIGYKIISGIVSLFNIKVERNVNIISVDGEAIKKWEVNEPADPKSSHRVLTVYLDYGVESDYTLTVNAEYNMGSTTADVSIPTMFCIGDDITRQRGYIAIEARTNVEISELSSNSLDAMDVQELPRELSSLATHPILLSYKFLDPLFQLQLRVKKNRDVQVLVSICESAHFITTMSNTGKTIHQYILSIKNTQKQFVRLQVPFNFCLWSTLMDGLPIRPSYIDNPASPDTPFLLVPLLKAGNPAQHDVNKPVQLEIVLLENEVRNISGQSGHLRFTMPKMDLPLRAAYCTLYLPESIKAGKSEGNLKCVSYFTSDPPQSITSPNPSDYQDYSRNDDMVNRRSSISYDRHSSNNYANKAGGGLFSNFSSYEKKPSLNKARKEGGVKGGVIPVRVEMPTTNNAHLYEQILLSGEKDLSFELPFKQSKVKVVRSNN